MLQFIVLGIIPGTSIQLDFTSVLLAIAAMVLTSSLWFNRARMHKQQHEQNKISLISL